MKDCFVMKSKKQQHKQKHSTLAKEPQFKRSEGNRSSIKRRIATTINEDENIVNPTTRSSDDNDNTRLSHAIKSPPFWKRIFKRRTLPGK